ncbi:MAG: hypoxanthine phosphoribosyltransferase [Clostridia bacterium]
MAENKNHSVENDISEVLFTQEQLQDIVKKIGKQIENDYKGKKLMLLGVLKGSVVFMSDIMRNVDLPLRIEFMSVSSYGSGVTSSGVVRVINDINVDLTGYHLVIIEDILDSGRTLSHLIKHLETKGAESIEICTLFDKPERREADVYAKYIGATVPDAFIVGYGLDYDEIYRNLPYIGVLKPEVYGG